MKHRIGIVGGGQLGRMLGFAAKKMGFVVTVIDPTPNSPAGQVVDEQIVANVKDEKAIRQLAKKSDYLTFEVELANAEILEELSKEGIEVHPSAKTLIIIKDKFAQKEFLSKAGIPVAESIAVENKEDILAAAKKFKYPFLLKARFDAYDGRGNALIKKPSDIETGMKKLEGRKLYVEKFVPFVKEVAVMVARSTTGEIKTYPVVETIHKNNICHLVLAPAPVNTATQKKAQNLAKKVMQNLKGAGVFGIEMFVTKSNKVIINEIAPRVHNAGHFSMEACVTPQFEQHIRAITGMPLGNTEMIVPAAVMINILGERQGTAEIKGLTEVLKMPNVAVHIYGKAETKIERKMGHITVIGDNLDKVKKTAQRVRAQLSI
jgi:5-(carboxyamino)imidazole ribonucleotide synthase